MHSRDKSEFPVTRDTLLLRLKAGGDGRELAWREFHARYAPIIAGFARRMGAAAGDIDDLVQDVMIGFFAASPRFVYDPARGRFRGYLKTCTWRVLQDRVGKRIRLGERPLEQVDPADLQVEAAWNDLWETEKLQRAVEAVREQYERRPDMRRTFQAFEMYVLLERPAEEVAAELGVSVGTVHQARTRVSSAIRAERGISLTQPPPMGGGWTRVR